MGRAPCCDKATVKRGPWAQEEDTKLKEYIEKNGTGGNWIALPQKIGLKRCGKSCRLRWLNYLRPNIKHGGFSEEEDNIICSLYISIGSRWSIIAAQLPGRTDNDIKNYWNTRLKKKLLGRRKQSNNINKLSPLESGTNGAKDINHGNVVDTQATLSNSALERILLHMQLQGLQNPLSFHNNPALWPKLHPFQEKMIQTLQMSLNHQSSNSHAVQHIFELPPIVNSITLLDQECGKIANRKGDEMSNSNMNVMPSSARAVDYFTGNNREDSSFTLVTKVDPHEVRQSNSGFDPEVSIFEAELDACLGNKTMGSSMTPEEDQIAEFDCYKEMSGCKDNLIWWLNDAFGTKSASSSSLDSTSVLRSEPLSQDFELGYNL